MDQYINLNDDEVFYIYKKISMNIKLKRKEKEISQADISNAMGFTTPTFYTNAENCSQGKHFNLEHIIRIAEYMKVDMSEFFKGIKL